MTKRKFISLGVSGIAMVMVLSGCGPGQSIQEKAGEKIGEKIMEGAIKSQTGGQADVDVNKQEMTIKTEQGEMNISSEGQGKLPDNFPKDVFTFSDSQVTFSGSNTTGADTYSVTYYTATQPAEAFEKYKTEMAGQGWTQKAAVDMGTSGKMLNFEKDQRALTVTIGTDTSSEHNGETLVTLIEAKKQ